MGRSFSVRLASWALLVAALLGLAILLSPCGIGFRATPAVAPEPAYKAEDPAAASDDAVVEPPRTPDGLRAVRMRTHLDEGNMAAALRDARELMDSPEDDVREEVVKVFTWCGNKAFPELVEMISDPAPSVANLAFAGWEGLLADAPTDRIKALRIVEMVGRIKHVERIKAALMALTRMDASVSLPALERIILDNKGKPASTCAKEMFAHLAEEPWASPARTQRILNEKLEDK